MYQMGGGDGMNQMAGLNHRLYRLGVLILSCLQLLHAGYESQFGFILLSSSLLHPALSRVRTQLGYTHGVE